MQVLETFVTRCNEVNTAFKTIQSNEIPDHFNQEFLTSLGFQKPNSILYVNLFKKLGLIDKDQHPVQKYYSEFVQSEGQAKLIIADLIRKTYSKVFEYNVDVYKLPNKKVREIFRKIIDRNKSETIVNMVADTFWALAMYADWEGLEEKQKNEVQMKTGKITNNGSVGEVVTAHEGFILELINECSEQANGNAVSIAGEINGKQRVNSIKEEPGKNEPDSSGQFMNVSENKSNGEINISSAHFGQPHKSEKNLKSPYNYYSQALIKRAELLARLERLDEAIGAYDDVIVYSDKNTESIGQENVFSAFYNKACMLEKLQKYEEALTTYDHFIKRFG